METATKACTKCGTADTTFHANKTARDGLQSWCDGLQSWCVDCCRVHHRVVRYGLTPERVRELEAGGCASCGSAFTSTRDCHFDHDHITGEFRDALCNGCNTALGLLQEDPERITALLAYALTWE